MPGTESTGADHGVSIVSGDATSTYLVGAVVTAGDEPFNPWANSYDQPASAAATAVVDDGFIDIELPSGASFAVATVEEADYCADRVEAYSSQLRFDNVSDLAELDRIIAMELMCRRWLTFLSTHKDYSGRAVDETELQKQLKAWSTEVRLLKKNLGIDKVARDRARGEGSAYQRISKILERARRFGIMRNQQSARAVELAMQAISMIDWAKNCTEDERRHFHITDADLFEWFDTVFRPEFMEIDAAFRAADQKMWIREMAP